MVKKQHLGVYCLIFSPENELALIHKKRGPYTGLLDLPGGSIEYGEEVEEALKREILEETGLALERFSLRNVISFNHEYQEQELAHNLFHIAIIYEGVVDEKEQLKPTVSDLDASDAEWVPLGALEQDKVSPLLWNVLARWEHSGF
ncbi:MAG: NUDIX domain-containing protein [Bacteroidetes bacterium]|nr:MAG: NUDIX domain-containing protein [Bacteroidota bacterium]